MLGRRGKICCGLLFTVFAGGAAVLTFLSSTRAEQARTPAPETLLPRDAVAYVGFDGLAAHREAFEKTAAYKAFYESGLMETLGKALGYGFRKAGKASGGEFDFALLKQILEGVSDNGASLAVTVSVDAGPPRPQVVAVLHRAAALEDRLSRTVKRLAAGKLKFDARTVKGRDVTRTVIPAEAPFELELGWWNEGDHLVVAFGADAVNAAIDVANGDAPDITANPLWKKHRKRETGFEVTTLAWLDAAALRKTFGQMPIPSPGPRGKRVRVDDVVQALGLESLGALVCRGGYKGESSWSEFRVETSGKRSGLLALMDQKPITLNDLPPLPANTGGFVACSINAAEGYEAITSIIKNVAKLGPEDAAIGAEVFIDQIPAIIGFNPKDDLLDALGDVACFYGDPEQGIFGIGFGLVVAVKNADKLQKTLDDLIDRFAPRAGEDLRVRRVRKHGRQLVIFEISGAPVSPTFVVDEKWMCIGLYPQTIEAFLLRLDGKLPTWKPGAEVKKGLAEMPEEFTLIAVSDPRQLYRMLLGAAPMFLPIIQQQLKLRDLPISVADLPPSELVTRSMFPNITVATVDENGLLCTSRSSVPSIPLLGFGGDATGVTSTAVLIALLLPAVHQARQAARRTQSKNNLKQIAIALHNYHDVHGSFPQGTHPAKGLDPEERLSWMATILPYIEQARLYNSLDFKKEWNAKSNDASVRAVIPPYQNAGVTERGENVYGTTHYVGIAGYGEGAATLPKGHKRAGVFGYDREVSLRDIRDGTSNTMGVAEASARFGPWAAGGDSTIRAFTKKPYLNGPDGIGGPWSGGATQVMMMDGSVRTLSETVDPKVIEGLSTYAGGEVIDLDDF